MAKSIDFWSLDQHDFNTNFPKQKNNISTISFIDKVKILQGDKVVCRMAIIK